MKSTVSERGQVTIPKALRERLGIGPGAILEFEEEQGRLVARKLSRRDGVDAVYGILEMNETGDELLARLRGTEAT